MKSWSAVLALSGLGLAALRAAAGPACLEPANRFRATVFPSTTHADHIRFGENRNPLFSDRLDDLKMNVYQPAGDACTKRPLVIFMHGGWMQGGDHNGENGSADQFARRGFVAATIDYRLGVGGTFTPGNFATPGFMAVQDARAANRFFRKNAAQYGIDTNWIFVGGCSAGAYAALFTGYLDRESEIPASVDAGARLGGIEGNSGNPGYSSRFHGVLPLSGGVLDTGWIDRGDIPVAAVQCSADPLVPPGAGFLKNPNTNVPFLESFGSTAIKARAGKVGVTAAVLTFQGACHCPHPGGPGGVDSTLDFFGKQAYAMMAAPPTAVRRTRHARAALDEGQWMALAAEKGWVDTQGRGLRRARPGVYFRRP